MHFIYHNDPGAFDLENSFILLIVQDYMSINQGQKSPKGIPIAYQQVCKQ